jgi:E2/UBC family protein E
MMVATDPDTETATKDGLDLLPGVDREVLRARGLLNAHASLVGQEIFLIIEDYPVPAGYDQDKVGLLLRLPRQWPDGAVDMFWTEPTLRIASTGQLPQATESSMDHDGRHWQRWSRHFPDWRPGRDGLETLLIIVNNSLKTSVPA